MSQNYEELASIFFISAIAFAGLRPCRENSNNGTQYVASYKSHDTLGHVLVQFMIV